LTELRGTEIGFRDFLSAGLVHPSTSCTTWTAYCDCNIPAGTLLPFKRAFSFSSATGVCKPVSVGNCFDDPNTVTLIP